MIPDDVIDELTYFLTVIIDARDGKISEEDFHTEREKFFKYYYKHIGPNILLSSILNHMYIDFRMFM